MASIATNQVVMVTGHRKIPLDQLDHVIAELHSVADRLAPSRMISGLALGVDTLWAQAALDRHVPLHAYLPGEWQANPWPNEHRQLWRSLRDAAESVHVEDFPEYNRAAFQRRNESMVDHCDVVVAVWNGSASGTANCVRYAKRQGVDVVLIHPDGRPTGILRAH